MNNQDVTHENVQEDEIEENIEMETNSIYSNSNKKKESEIKHEYLNEKQIAESINDSLDDFTHKNNNHAKKEMHEAMMSSHYGFG